MKRFALLLGVVCLGITSRASAATDETRFLALLKSRGITGPPDSKRPCVCVGGSENKKLGFLIAIKVVPAFQYDCDIPGFDSSTGARNSSASCIDGGGAVVLIDK
jgi:hypothetical protein